MCLNHVVLKGFGEFDRRWTKNLFFPRRKMSGQIRPAPQSLHIRLWRQQNHSEMGDEQHHGRMRETSWVYNTSTRTTSLQSWWCSCRAGQQLRGAGPCALRVEMQGPRLRGTCFFVYTLARTGLFRSVFKKKTTPALINHSKSSSRDNIKSSLTPVTADWCEYFHVTVLIGWVTTDLNQLMQNMNLILLTILTLPKSYEMFKTSLRVVDLYLHLL